MKSNRTEESARVAARAANKGSFISLQNTRSRQTDTPPPHRPPNGIYWTSINRPFLFFPGTSIAFSLDFHSLTGTVEWRKHRHQPGPVERHRQVAMLIAFMGVIPWFDSVEFIRFSLDLVKSGLEPTLLLCPLLSSYSTQVQSSSLIHFLFVFFFIQRESISYQIMKDDSILTWCLYV